MAETRKIAAILVADVVGYSRLAAADKDRTLSRLRGLRSDLIRAAHGGSKVRPAAPLGRRHAVREYRRRPGAGAFRRRSHREPHDRPLTDTRRYGVARNTAFTYKGRRVDVKTIGRELNVRYVLEGSVQRGGNRMRVNVQLIDAESGDHLWAERFDKPLADLFDMQDEIVARLAGALNGQLVAAEARRAEKAPTPDSMDLYFQGLAWLNKGPTPDNVAQARSFFDRALTADAVNVDALIGSAWADTIEGASAFVAKPMAAFAAAEAKLTKALSLVPDHAPGHMYVRVCRGFTPSALRRASPNVNMRWRWIEISPLLMPLSDLVRFSPVVPKRQRLTSARQRASVRAIPMPMPGRLSWASRSSLSAVMSRRPRGSDGRSRPTEIIRYRISCRPPALRSLVGLTMRIPQSGPVSR